MPQPPQRSRLVYTTDPQPEAEREQPAAPAPAYPSANKQTARIARDRKRRAGKTVTVISGLRHDPATLEALLKTLKQRCGAGGSVKDGEIEIQGDQRERVTDVLQSLGYGTKHVGG